MRALVVSKMRRARSSSGGRACGVVPCCGGCAGVRGGAGQRQRESCLWVVPVKLPSCHAATSTRLDGPRPGLVQQRATGPCLNPAHASSHPARELLVLLPLQLVL